ncbi:hypothetical protein D9611_000657 [Ephemerocybe angulata]|uniref:Uncharacterized protein n=1 Tax=Ephemerocybe angulata TaxID=980116 RepID=A0A8H5BNA2_9AGAR|nr:hypothetical protein D9611_000657 [Tulosesus angulatus]
MVGGRGERVEGAPWMLRDPSLPSRDFTDAGSSSSIEGLRRVRLLVYGNSIRTAAEMSVVPAAPHAHPPHQLDLRARALHRFSLLLRKKVILCFMTH